MAEPRRIFAPPEAFCDGGLRLEGERLRHLRTVLRLGPGDEFSATDGAGGEYRLRIEHLGRDRGRALVLARTEPLRESPLDAGARPGAPQGRPVLDRAREGRGARGAAASCPLLSRRTVRRGRRRRRGRGALAAHRRVRRRPVREDPAAGAAPAALLRGADRGPGPARAALLLWEHATDGSARGDRPPRRAALACSWRSGPRAAGRSRRCSGRGTRDSPPSALARAS